MSFFNMQLVSLHILSGKSGHLLAEPLCLFNEQLGAPQKISKGSRQGVYQFQRASDLQRWKTQGARLSGPAVSADPRTRGPLGERWYHDFEKFLSKQKMMNMELTSIDT